MFKLVVLCSLLAASAAKPGYLAPLAYSTVPVASSLSEYSTSVVHGTPLYTAGVYSAPYVVPVAALSQAPNSPAVVLDAVNGVPLDTPEVVAARAAHYQAKALSGLHHLKKRSLAPLSYSTVVSPVTHSAVLSPLTYSASYVPGYSTTALVSSPLAYSGVFPKAYGVHPW
ncbi:unnamed protein product, partial [Iphiclides podalirius]